ncbi:formin-like protein 5 [Iris pallida]|uniref:Formin-like protein 5 n=1 Tax=Iris pallida TaxID=29817 RepID=A0AAX6DVY3_IRIPA|nr:formin-like protein 5 [Iris pallida]KAJ6795839.1 formin-like protein 5 [Iris pallida]
MPSSSSRSNQSRPSPLPFPTSPSTSQNPDHPQFRPNQRAHCHRVSRVRPRVSVIVSIHLIPLSITFTSNHYRVRHTRHATPSNRRNYHHHLQTNPTPRRPQPPANTKLALQNTPPKHTRKKEWETGDLTTLLAAVVHRRRPSDLASSSSPEPPGHHAWLSLRGSDFPVPIPTPVSRHRVLAPLATVPLRLGRCHPEQPLNPGPNHARSRLPSVKLCRRSPLVPNRALRPCPCLWNPQGPDESAQPLTATTLPHADDFSFRLAPLGRRSPHLETSACVD